MAKPNHFWRAFMRRFWYFDVSKWSCGKKSCFQDCSKLVGLLQQGFILHGLNSQISPKDPIAVLTSQNTNQIDKDSPSDNPRHTQTASDTKTPSYIFKHSRRINPAHQYLWGETREEPSYHFSTILKCEILSCLVLLRQRNTKTAAYQLSKNDWVRPFSVSFRFVREKLFVTVAFDHPVLGDNFTCKL